MNNILESRKIFKSYQNNRKLKLEVLKDISLSIERNKISVIVGASGAGKSTLLHILSGLDRPDSGEVLFESENIFNYTDEKLSNFRNRNIGFVFQFHHLLPEFTAAENVAIPRMAAGAKFNEAISRADELLELVGLFDRKDHKPSELSGGEQQRVAVARALVNDPKIIFADEPTGNLDSKNSESIHQLIIRLRDEFNKTFVIVTHNPDLMNLADRIFEIKDGRLINQQ
ncbi:Lipoprotein-releasing system ATP-binding protein [Ignavibacterium album JCM 16511]|uniref:Lipoprotein-releasing system ATP-binding protein n=1 Tax=Ignavibacterium album (strain DSM 19864 / JCM 16511 / NBRC 101810 / Mat9-16) TaxID=945713 RepID=I0AJQ6_IGNAJ|nr:ABC transporter ATP-binding protein [Ignavibacterium album]AFH49213.1 Lipoprotein-releasing system ATP-binding protein [Ignavibacterium album JCM 16511]